eukprot:scaffold3265_cov117-Isochrysis_galbana.AAC.5
MGRPGPGRTVAAVWVGRRGSGRGSGMGGCEHAAVVRPPRWPSSTISMAFPPCPPAPGALHVAREELAHSIPQGKRGPHMPTGQFVTLAAPVSYRLRPARRGPRLQRHADDR